MSYIEIPVIKVNQSNWSMYVGVIKAQDLFFMEKVDRIRLEKLEIPKYAGFQRAINEERVYSIKEYLQTSDCTFPNSIIINIESDFIIDWLDSTAEGTVSNLKIKKEEGAISIIDGQHRAAALSAANSDFDVIVTIFIDLSITNCAQIFSKINSTQKTVNPSIAFQLFGYASSRSPQKTAHEIAEIVNNTEGSPFYKKLKMLGTKDDWTNGILSQSTFCKELISLYSKNYQEDEYRIAKNERLSEYLNYPLRKYFINKQDKIILDTIWNFFYSIAKTWPDQWNDSGVSILPKTTGFKSMIQLLKYWLNKSNALVSKSDFERYFRVIKSDFEEPGTKFVRENFPAGQQGVTPLKNKLIEKFNSFSDSVS